MIMLINAMCMHGSCELGVDMAVVTAEYSDRVAYNVGGKVVTLRYLLDYLNR